LSQVPDSLGRVWSRAFGPGSGRARAFAAAAVGALAVVAALVFILTRGDEGASAATRYGQLPSWLPKAKTHTGRTVVASSAHPRLAIEGDSVVVDLTGGRTLATAVGPEVPEDGKFPVPPTSPCTFTVTLTSAHGAVPLEAGAFTILDELSHVHHPHVTAAGGGPLPARVRPGQTVKLRVSDVLPTGGGRLRWAPDGAKPIASWDFDVEID
jgi:hypothetical protein